MAQKVAQNYATRTKVRRRGRLRPLNHQKKLGPTEGRRPEKKSRGQG
jgi:hypothetical protein